MACRRAQALRCADFFGLPVLVVHANQWIADHLDSKNASQLWNFVDAKLGIGIIGGPYIEGRLIPRCVCER